MGHKSQHPLVLLFFTSSSGISQDTRELNPFLVSQLAVLDDVMVEPYLSRQAAIPPSPLSRSVFIIARVPQILEPMT